MHAALEPTVNSHYSERKWGMLNLSIQIRSKKKLNQTQQWRHHYHLPLSPI